MIELVETLQLKALLVLHKMHDLRSVKQFQKDERGVTAMEYGLIAALIGVAAIAAMNTLGTNMGGRFNNVASTIANPN